MSRLSKDGMDTANLIDAINGAHLHRLVPGSHERGTLPECICGGQWDTWNDGCVRHAESILGGPS